MSRLLFPGIQKAPKTFHCMQPKHVPVEIAGNGNQNTSDPKILSFAYKFCIHICTYLFIEIIPAVITIPFYHQNDFLEIFVM